MGSAGVSFLDAMPELVDAVGTAYDAINFYRGLELIAKHLHVSNQIFQSNEPWLLAKSSSDTDVKHLECLLSCTLRSLDVIAALLTPIVPTISQNIFHRIGRSGDPPSLKSVMSCRENETALNPANNVLFRRLRG